MATLVWRPPAQEIRLQELSQASWRGVGPVEATQWGVYLHGEAGNRLAQSRGPLGFLARELLDEIPAIMASF